MSGYIVPAGYGEAEYTDKKSRFIGQVSPAESEAAAQDFIKSVRAKHPDAAHNVWAYSLNGGVMRYSDDGEPGGTSGQPTLNVFRSAGVLQVCCVVTRYFGGILLGSGGLVRAYSKAASMALEAAGLARMAPFTALIIDCAYPQYERVRRLLEDFNAEEIEATFSEGVTVSAFLASGATAEFSARLTDVTAGAATLREGGVSFRPAKI